MDNKKFGAFLSELRKAKGMTQKELAAKLNVTDKAVSKWERGMGYPEITILPNLADALEVTTSELLQSEHEKETEQSKNVDAEPMIRSAVEYTKQSRSQKYKKIKRLIFYIFSISLLLAAGICILCNYVSRHTLDWSYYVIGGEAAAWLTISPLLLLKKHRCVVSLAALTVSAIPLLLLIKALCPSPEIIIPFVFPITAISICSLWILLPIFRLKIHLGYRISLLLFVYGVVVDIILNTFIHGYLQEGDSIATPIVAASCALAAIITALITKYQSKTPENE